MGSRIEVPRSWFRRVTHWVKPQTCGKQDLELVFRSIKKRYPSAELVDGWINLYLKPGELLELHSYGKKNRVYTIFPVSEVLYDGKKVSPPW